MNGFPYWQGSDINSAKQVFFDAVGATKAVIGNKPFIIGETGWPTAGDNFGAAVPSVANLQSYWTETVCAIQAQGIPYFFFSTFDEPNRESAIEKNFGIATSDKKLKISMACRY